MPGRVARQAVIKALVKFFHTQFDSRVSADRALDFHQLVLQWKNDNVITLEDIES